MQSGDPVTTERSPLNFTNLNVPPSCFFIPSAAVFDRRAPLFSTAVNKVAQDWIDSCPRKFDRSYFSYYSQAISSLATGKKISVDELEFPDRKQVYLAIARNVSICEVLGFQHFERELSVLGIQRINDEH